MLLSQWDRTGWDPFAGMRRLQTDVNRLLDGYNDFEAARPASRTYPAINLWLRDRSFLVTAELPGLSHQDIELSIVDDKLTISGDRPEPVNDEEIVWRRRECPGGKFSRTVVLPYRVDPDRVEARFADGVLEVELYRPEADLPRKVEVKTN